MRALLAPEPTASLWGSTWESHEDSASTTAPQQCAVLSLTANEHPSGFADPYPGVLSDGVLFSGCSTGLVPSKCLAETCVCSLWARGWCEPTYVRGQALPCMQVGAMCDHAPLTLPQTYAQFWPIQGEDDYGRFHVQLISEEPGSGFTTWTLVLSNRQQVGPLLRNGKLL